jgi:TFIIF-interacting CTD phosphatase-like protein
MPLNDTFNEKHILSVFYFKNHCRIIDGVFKI